jgi:hypothetical protein
MNKIKLEQKIDKITRVTLNLSEFQSLNNIKALNSLH